MNLLFLAEGAKALRSLAWAAATLGGNRDKTEGWGGPRSVTDPSDPILPLQNKSALNPVYPERAHQQNGTHIFFPCPHGHFGCSGFTQPTTGDGQGN